MTTQTQSMTVIGICVLALFNGWVCLSGSGEDALIPSVLIALTIVATFDITTASLTWIFVDNADVWFWVFVGIRYLLVVMKKLHVTYHGLFKFYATWHMLMWLTVVADAVIVNVANNYTVPNFAANPFPGWHSIVVLFFSICSSVLWSVALAAPSSVQWKVGAENHTRKFDRFPIAKNDAKGSDNEGYSKRKSVNKIDKIDKNATPTKRRCCVIS